jgi:hypothetical protein
VRAALLAGVPFVAALVASACGGSVGATDTSSIGPEDPTGTGGQGGGTSLPDGGFTPSNGGAGGFEPGLTDARYDDPGCKPTKKVEGQHECDTETQSGCQFGDRCVPYVSYGTKCEAEEVGTRCEIAGFARQGDDCSSETCAAGFVCVTGGAGFQCAELCTLKGSVDSCPPGLLCSPLDVDGFSVCS